MTSSTGCGRSRIRPATLATTRRRGRMAAQRIIGADPPPHPEPLPSRGQRFLASYYWLVLKNVIGWLLILASFVAGPLVPGPGGIPLFLIGFALVSFPGKRRLTARVLRGRPVHFPPWPFAFVALVTALAVPALVLPLARA